MTSYRASWFNPWLLQFSCQSNLGQDTERQVALDVSFRVWLLDRKHLDIEISACVNEACSIKRFESSRRIEKCRRRTSPFDACEFHTVSDFTV